MPLVNKFGAFSTNKTLIAVRLVEARVRDRTSV